jgi:hypothetical protein
MFHAAHTIRRAIAATIVTMVLTSSFLSAGNGPADARFAERHILPRASDGITANRMALLPAVPVESSSGRIWRSAPSPYSGLHLNSDLSGKLLGYVKVQGVYTV